MDTAMDTPVQTPPARVKWLDGCKGFAAICVVLGHICNGYMGANLFQEHIGFIERTFNFLYTFHMPLFFCLSGYAFYIAYLRDREAKRQKYRMQIMNIIYIYIYKLFLVVDKMDDVIICQR